MTKRILFVDDEPALLDGLRGRLRSLRSCWEMVFVESGPKAIAEMEARTVDVIVADIRMPGMDGAQLLGIVRERWPQTIRIVLSGFAEDEHSARLLSVAHQYLSKPCEPHHIENVINRCLLLHELLLDDGLRRVVGRIKHLPAIPRTYARLRDAMLEPEPTTRQISAIIYEDPVIAAKVLQVVNSAFFRLARRITRIDQAVSHLGFDAIRTLVMSVEVFRSCRADSAGTGIEIERLQERAHRVAAAAYALSKGTALADDALLAGLFHNLGYWILLQECPQELARAVQMARTQGMPLHEAERITIGASNAQVGAYLLGVWGLQYDVVEAVAFQHDPHRAGQTRFDVLAALVVAERLATVDAPLLEGMPESTSISIDDNYLLSLGAPFDWAQARQRVLETAGELQS